jgi:hypothetical protein
MKIVITATRNERPLDPGWSEQELSEYAIAYVEKRYILPRMQLDLPEFDVTVEVT